MSAERLFYCMDKINAMSQSLDFVVILFVYGEKKRSLRICIPQRAFVSINLLFRARSLKNTSLKLPDFRKYSTCMIKK